ncbi:MAG: class I SAM-dependent methyltransferase [Chloroflexota bacterium]
MQRDKHQPQPAEQEQNRSAPRTQESYDLVAGTHTELFLHEFDHKPLDREVLDRFAERTAGKGRVLDLGCGPGQAAAYLHSRGADAFGIDLSPAMLEQAKQANPDIDFQQGDMRSLDLPDESLAGIAAFYSIIHIPREEVAAVLRGMRRVLQPGGLLLLAFHRGDSEMHRDELWDIPVSLDFAFFEPPEMEIYLRAGGFLIDDVVERDPYPDVEYPSRRVYMLASKPGA